MTFDSTDARRRRRRALLKGFTLAPLWPAWPAAARAAQERTLSFYHTHTDERLRIAYFAGGAYVPDALRRIDYLLRDFRTGAVHEIDRRLLDSLHLLCAACGGGTLEVISGYRSAETNRMLLDGGGVARKSLHMNGQAVDVRISGFDTARLRDAALALGAGGVGYYPASDFVHLDTGRVRSWTYG